MHIITGESFEIYVARQHQLLNHEFKLGEHEYFYESLYAFESEKSEY